MPTRPRRGLTTFGRRCLRTFYLKDLGVSSSKPGLESCLQKRLRISADQLVP